MRPLSLRLPRAVEAERAARMSDALTDPRLVGASQLVGTFRGSRGFGLVFRDDAHERVAERFPALEPFLSLLSMGRPWRALRPLTRLSPRVPNAYYLNVLVLDEGRGVGRHVDGTLQDAAEVPALTPEVVTALYLSVPRRRAGGELVLYRGAVEAAVHEPAEGALIHFRGDLSHEVRPLEGADGPRVSLVCEQYALAPEAWRKVPPLRLQSRAMDPVFAGARPDPQPFGQRLRRSSP